jgi:hypothetical protein
VEATMGESDSQLKGNPGKPASELKVTDRRHFTLEGERREDVPEEPAQAPEAKVVEVGAERGNRSRPGFEHRSLDEPEGVDFTMLINAMAQPALLFLGEIPHPGTGEVTIDTEQARIQIDLLDLLRVKSRGNLTPAEEGLLERVLYQLRMLYVARNRKRD